MLYNHKLCRLVTPVSYIKEYHNNHCPRPTTNGACPVSNKPLQCGCRPILAGRITNGVDKIFYIM